MVLQVFSTLVLAKFQNAMTVFAILPVLVPLLTDAGGNAGGQTTTLIVRSISLDEFGRGDFKRAVWKEFRVALCIACIISIFAFGLLMLEMTFDIADVSGPAKALGVSKIVAMLVTASLVSCTLFVTMLVARLVACMFPFLAKKLKLDPAVVCGPFNTTIVDVISLLVYFFLWTFVFSHMLGL
jgi:magnesium transporter